MLGGLMLDELAFDQISNILGADDFYRGDHRIIFRCMQTMVEPNKPLDIITISESLNAVNELGSVAGIAYLSDLANSIPTTSNIRAYATIVVERATVRKLISVAHDIADSGFNPEGRDSAALIDMAESKVLQIGDSRPSTGGPQSVRSVLTKAVERIDELFQTKGGLTGLSAGFRDLDEMTMGLQKGDLVIVAGRPPWARPVSR